MFSFLRRKCKHDDKLDEALDKFKKSSDTKMEVVEDLRESVRKSTSDRSSYQLEAVGNEESEETPDQNADLGSEDASTEGVADAEGDFFNPSRKRGTIGVTRRGNASGENLLPSLDVGI